MPEPVGPFRCSALRPHPSAACQPQPRARLHTITLPCTRTLKRNVCRACRFPPMHAISRPRQLRRPAIEGQLLLEWSRSAEGRALCCWPARQGPYGGRVPGAASKAQRGTVSLMQPGAQLPSVQQAVRCRGLCRRDKPHTCCSCLRSSSQQGNTSAPLHVLGFHLTLVGLLLLLPLLWWRLAALLPHGVACAGQRVHDAVR